MPVMDKNLINAAHRHFRKTDSVMADLIKQCDPITSNRSKQPHYHALVSAIINQQLSYKAGQTIEKRLLEKQRGRFFRADKLLELKATEIRSCGLSDNKVRYVCTLAQAIADGELNFRKLVRKNDDAVREALIQYPGIGQWSVDMFLMFSLQRPDVFPIGDLVIRRSIQQHYRLPAGAKHGEYFDIAEAWRPYRSIASFYLWKMSD
jgi:DNA-3-methyladenine glycosylase II